MIASLSAKFPPLPSNTLSLEYQPAPSLELLLGVEKLAGFHRVLTPLTHNLKPPYAYWSQHGVESCLFEQL